MYSTDGHFFDQIRTFRYISMWISFENDFRLPNYCYRMISLSNQQFYAELNLTNKDESGSSYVSWNFVTFQFSLKNAFVPFEFLFYSMIRNVSYNCVKIRRLLQRNMLRDFEESKSQRLENLFIKNKSYNCIRNCATELV